MKEYLERIMNIIDEACRNQELTTQDLFDLCRSAAADLEAKAEGFEWDLKNSSE